MPREKEEGGTAVLDPPAERPLGAVVGREKRPLTSATPRLQPVRQQVAKDTLRACAINGAGDIGRNILRYIAEQERDGRRVPPVTHIAEEFLTRDQIFDLLVNDPVRGRIVGVSAQKVGTDRIRIGQQEIVVLHGGVTNIIDWGRLEVWGVFEATGQRVDGAKAEEHISEGGGKKVLITAPAKGEMPVKSLVVGFNEEEYQPEMHHVVENASCTTKSALHPLNALLHEVRIESVTLTTIHADTGPERRALIANRGRIEDFSKCGFRQESTGASKALQNLLPALEKKLNAFSYRVPVTDGSVSEIVVELGEPRSEDSVAQVLRDAQRQRIMQFLEGAVVTNSSELIGNPHDAVIFGGNLRADGRLVHISSGYDNAYAPAAAAVDLMKYMAARK